MKLWDIAGLVPDAHLGRGRGVQFLDDVRQAQALVQVIDASGKTDLEGNPAEGFDPALAVEMLEKEYAWWMAGILKKMIATRKSQKISAGDIEKQLTGLGVKEYHIEQALAEVSITADGLRNTTDEKIFDFCSELRKFSKPAMVVANKIDLGGAWENYEKMKSKLKGRTVVAASADYELALREAAKEGLIKYIPGSGSFYVVDDSKLNERQKKGLAMLQKFLDARKTTGVQSALNSCAFDLLNLIVAFPVADAHRLSDNKGNVLPDSFLLPKGATARDLAFAVHEDIGKKFISALNVRTGLNVGGDEALKDGDVISIKSGR